MNRVLLPVFLGLLATPTAAAQSVIDDFETYSIASGSAETTGSISLDDTTITGTGQGPGLVSDGCTYSAYGGELQWNGDAYFGLGTRTLLANLVNTLTLEYDSPVTQVDLELKAFSGFPDSVVITGLLGGSVVYTSAPIAVAGPGAVPFSLTGTTVDEISITGSYTFSPIIDNHAYRGGMRLDINGLCPGPATVVLTGATPFGSVAFASSPALGTYSIPSGPCLGTLIDLATPTLLGYETADGSGTINLPVFLPAGLCGQFVQAVDMTTCIISNTTTI